MTVTRPILSAEHKAVDATLPHLSDTVRRMVLLQLATGMRSGELYGMRWDLINRHTYIWIYTPAEHKTEHHGNGRTAPIPPMYQHLLGQPKEQGNVFEHHRNGPYNGTDLRPSDPPYDHTHKLQELDTAPITTQRDHRLGQSRRCRSCTASSRPLNLTHDIEIH